MTPTLETQTQPLPGISIPPPGKPPGTGIATSSPDPGNPRFRKGKRWLSRILGAAGMAALTVIVLDLWFHPENISENPLPWLGLWALGTTLITGSLWYLWRQNQRNP